MRTAWWTTRQVDRSRHRSRTGCEKRAVAPVIVQGSALLGSTHSKQAGSTREVFRVQSMALRFEDLLHDCDVAIGAWLTAQQLVFIELVEERLPIVQIAEQVLPLFEVANSSAAFSDSRRLRDLHGIPQLLDGDPRRVASTREIDAGRMVDCLNRRTRSRDEHES